MEAKIPSSLHFFTSCTLLLGLSTVEALEYCEGDYWCSNGHCCGHGRCCTYYYEIWWFWLIWAIIALMGCCCYYQQRRIRAKRLRVHAAQHAHRNLTLPHGAHVVGQPPPSDQLQESHNSSVPDRATMLEPNKVFQLPAYDDIKDLPREPPAYSVVDGSSMCVQSADASSISPTQQHPFPPSVPPADVVCINESGNAGLLDNMLESPSEEVSPIPSSPPPYSPTPGIVLQN